MQKILFLALLLTLTFSCKKSSDPSPETSFNVEGNWSLDYYFSYRKQANADPLQATLNAMPGQNVLNLKADGTAQMINLGLDDNSFNIFTTQTIDGTWKTLNSFLFITFTKNGKVFNQKYKIIKATSTELEISKDLSLVKETLEDNKDALGPNTYIGLKNEFDLYTKVTLEGYFVKK